MKKIRPMMITAVVALLGIFVLAFYSHWTSREYVIFQFNERQLQMVRQTAIQIESYLRSRSHDLRQLSESALVQEPDSNRSRAGLLERYKHLKTINIKEISLLNRSGSVTFSTTSGVSGENHAASNFFRWAIDPANRGEVWIGYEKAGGLRDTVPSAGHASDHIGVTLVTPLYRRVAAADRRREDGIFVGVLMFKIDLAGMLAERSLLFNPALKLHSLWVMDRDGTVLLQSDHPEMVMGNVRQRDQTCGQCHASFGHVEMMLSQGEGVTTYQLIERARKLAAFAPVTVENASWVAVVNAPLDEVTASVRKGLQETLALLGLVVIVMGIALFVSYRIYRERVDHETAMNALLNVSMREVDLDQRLTEMLEILFSLRWLRVAPKGCVFLVKEKKDHLVMAVHRGFDSSRVERCAEVPFGRCICGRAAQTGEVEFAAGVDERHDNLPGSVSPHGRYCVPVKSQGRVVGVLNLYLQAGHHRNRREEQFLLAVAGVMAGMIERKHGEEQVRKSEERFHRIVDNATEGIFQSTAEGRLLIANRALAAMLGYVSVEECLVKTTDIGHQVYVDPEQRLELIRRVDDEGDVRGFETQFHTVKGDRFWVSINMQSIRDDNGRLLYYQGICEEITEKKQREEERREAVQRLRQALGGTVKAIAAVVETRDPYTAGHQRRVADLARAIATEMDLEINQIEGLRVAAMIHDIGKIAVPSEILSKPTKLTENEFSLIKNHVQTGYEILKDIDFPWPVAKIVLEHHERIDGSGYPGSLRGDRILIEARILAVADVVEAIASHRPYRAGLGLAAALDEIAKNSGTRYDSKIVEVCLRLFEERDYRIIQ